MSIVRIIPKVKSYTDHRGRVDFKTVCPDMELSGFHKELLSEFSDCKRKKNLFFTIDHSYKTGAYSIEIHENAAECRYADREGLHNCICTLHQLLAQVDSLTTCSIYDEPLFKTRAVMIDISRNKVPKLNTLKEIARCLSLLKINNLQLYMEGRSFYYGFLSEYYENRNDYLLPGELTELYRYCKEIGITLTPNTNCFGHMAYWLNQKELNHLALKPHGFEFSKHGTRGYAQTIDPENDEAYEFVIRLIDELLCCFPECSSITIGGDEPLELLFPKKDPRAAELYLNHMTKVIDHIVSKGITPYMWGDFVKEYPETLSNFQDTVLLEWGYDAGSLTDGNCRLYRDKRIPFMVCPGTSGWLSFSGRMDNMIANFKEAVVCGSANGAQGMIITDWNDGGAYSQLPTNLLSYAHGACYAWGNGAEAEADLHAYLDDSVFGCKLSDAIFALGNYYTCQNAPTGNMTKLFTSFFSCQTDGINMNIGSYSDCNALSNNKNVLDYEEIEKTKEYLSAWKDQYLLDFLNSENLYAKELLFVYRLICHALSLNYVYLQLMNVKDCIQELRHLSEDVRTLIDEYNRIWHIRNKESDYRYSVKRLEMLEYKYWHLLYLMRA